MEQQKSLLSSLLRNTLDRVTIIYNLQKLKVDHDGDEPFVILKYKLQLQIIDNILKEVDIRQNVYFARLKKETEDYLEFHNQKVEKSFKCCLVGCLFKCKPHRDYIRHLKRAHTRESQLVCQFGLICKRTFSSVDLLLQHIDHVHFVPRSARTESTPVDIPCKCPLLKCVGKHFPNIRSLMLHMRRDHLDEVIECIFEDCDKKFSNANALRSHFSLKHIKLNLCSLKTAYKLDQFRIEVLPHQNLLVDEVEDCDIEEELVSAEQDYNEEDTSEDNSEKDLDDEFFMMAYCDFLNRMANFHFIPQSTIDVIGAEYLKNYTKSNEAKAVSLKNSLMKIPGISESDIQRVMDDFHSQDAFLLAQTKTNSEYKRTKFIRENFTFVSPLEIVLNPREVKEEKAPKAVMHYIPIIETFKNLVQDPSFIEMMEKNVVTNDSESSYKDVKDGDLYKNNPYFQRNPGAYTMMIYSDAIELVNPLGAGRGKHKVIQIFFSLSEIAKHQRSKIDRIQLVSVFKESLIKKFGFKKIYQKLVDDLKVLEAGVTVNYPVQRLVKSGLLIHPADNLEAHGVGGFSRSFSSKDICRFCHIQYTDLLDNIHDYGGKVHDKWSVVDYDRAAVAAERLNTYEADQHDLEEEFSLPSDDSDADECCVDESDETEGSDQEDTVELFGIKHVCPLNSLESFHSTTGFPPDILHDIFEGVISQDLLGIIRILSCNQWFSIEEYNASLQSLNYKSYEANDRPQVVPINKKTKKLNGKACSIWLHMRNFPFVIRKFVKSREDPVLLLGLKLHEITERITAHEFKEYEVCALEDLIIEFLDERKKIFEDYQNLMGPPKPKTHFLSHYPQAIRLHGPPMTYWTARYESRHRLAKNAAESAKNFRNISFTVSTRQQMRLSSVFYHGMFATSDIVISDQVVFKRTLKGNTDFDKSILPYMSEKDFLCSKIEVKSQLYKTGQLVVLEMLSPDEMKVGLIASILMKEESAYFVTKEFVATRHPLQYFQAQSDDSTMTLRDAKRIVDFKPLINHGTSSQLYFVLHHHISFSYP